jgi:hypothetical protein
MIAREDKGKFHSHTSYTTVWIQDTGLPTRKQLHNHY